MEVEFRAWMEISLQVSVYRLSSCCQQPTFLVCFLSCSPAPAPPGFTGSWG